MNDLTIGLLSALLATNQPQAVSNLIQQNTGTSVTIVNPDDPSEKQLLQIMADDDASLAFLEVLRAKGVVSHFRRPRGRDIDAACGQLRRRAAAG